ncbi:MAG: YpbF family protein [Leptolyngbyaceae cyanobacterium MAG.088]|nr:YpbF family protein [Leptolyngbyaceae cyanobacterium MAG.088]
MQHSQEPTLEKSGIRWSWFTLSCACLFAGCLYLAVVDLTGPVQLTQNSIEQQP